MGNRRHRILLTGGSGVLGRSFLDCVAGDPAIEVLSLLRPSSRGLCAEPQRERRVDFGDKAVLDSIVDEFRPTCLLHAAATGMNLPRPAWADMVRFNVDVTLDLCRSVSRVPGCRMVLVGTGLAYRNQDRPLTESDPIDTLHPYGASKAAADILARAAAVEFGVPLTVVRPFSFTGVRDDGTRLFPSLLRAAVEGRRFGLSPGDQRRDHCSARDIAAGIVAAIKAEPEDPRVPRVYNLGSGSMRSLRDMLGHVTGELGLNVALDFGAQSYAPYEPMCLVCDGAAARRDLGWSPRHNLAHAVWQLARESFPTLQLREPREDIPE